MQLPADGSYAYTYDAQGQLLTETYGGKTYTYTYDTYGNIRSVSDGTTTKVYSYGDSSWLDLLTAYDGQSISYDSIGNPTSWYDGTTFTWSNGRRLTSAVNSSTGLNNSYTYDMDGLRLTKTVGNVEHKYVWQGSKLVAEYFGGTELEFFYDENGSPYAFSYKATASATPVMYYYVTNLQGDVVSILNAGGTSVAEYSYNAWGKVLSATGTMAAINPIRYRGYYFDSDSGLYYLKSRYYDPNLQRFINSDGQLTTGDFIGANLFAYCNNSPILYIDSFGNAPQLAGVRSFFEEIFNFISGLKEGIKSKLATAADMLFGDTPAEDSNIYEYGEHKNKGTTNRANRERHEEGQARKQRDSGGEKGDARRRGNPNKRRIDLIPEDVTSYIVGGALVTVSAIGLVYLVSNDITGVGVLDDFAIVPTIEIFKTGINMVLN